MSAQRRSAVVVSLSLTVLFLTVALQIPAQVADQDERVAAPVFQGRHEVNIGSVEVTVVDKDGRPVPGLRAEEFALIVDGEPREITHFAEFGRPVQGTASEDLVASAKPPTAAEEEVSGQPRDSRFLVIFVDCRDNYIYFARR